MYADVELAKCVHYYFAHVYMLHLFAHRCEHASTATRVLTGERFVLGYMPKTEYASTYVS